MLATKEGIPVRLRTAAKQGRRYRIRAGTLVPPHGVEDFEPSVGLFGADK
jgi:hypothetical protein